MRVTVTIPDEIYEQYQQQAVGRGVNAVIVERLTVYKDAEPRARPIILTAEWRQRLEDILETTVEKPQDVVELCERLVKIGMDGVEYQLTVDELERMQEQAEFMGVELPAYIEQTLAEFTRHGLNLS